MADNPAVSTFTLPGRHRAVRVQPATICKSHKISCCYKSMNYTIFFILILHVVLAVRRVTRQNKSMHNHTKSFIHEYRKLSAHNL